MSKALGIWGVLTIQEMIIKVQFTDCGGLGLNRDEHCLLAYFDVIVKMIRYQGLVPKFTDQLELKDVAFVQELED